MEETTDTFESESTTEEVAESENTEESDIAQDSQDSDQAQEQSEPQGESEDNLFFDPNLVPDELKPAYKQMQGAFTKKTQEIADMRKAFEAEVAELREKATVADKYADYAPILDEMLAGKREEQVNPQLAGLEQQLRERGYSEEAIDLMKLGAEFTLNMVNQTTQQKEAAANFDRGVEAAANLDPRLSDSSLVYSLADGTQVTFGQIVADHVQADPQWMNDPRGATQRAIQKVDALIATAKAQGKEELSSAAKSKTKDFPEVKSSPQSARSTGQPMTVLEAAKLAEEQLGI